MGTFEGCLELTMKSLDHTYHLRQDCMLLCYRLNSLYYLSVNVLCVWPNSVIFLCCDLCMSSWAQGPSELDLYIVCS